MNNKKQKLFKELLFFSQKHLKHLNCFICVYGSYVSGYHNNTSDIDMFIATEKYNINDFEKTRNFFIDLHICNNLKLDNEVPYENKLIISYEDIKCAIALKPFIKKGLRYYIPIIKKNNEFLASPEIRWRLILNALTSPNECIHGDKARYVKFKDDAEKTIIKLAHGLVKTKSPTLDELVEVLLFGSQGEEGEMYLGYKKEQEKVIKYLKELIMRNHSFNIY